MTEFISTRKEKIADWVEFSCIFHQEEISKSVLMNILEENGVDSFELIATEVIAILSERIRFYGSESPVKQNGSRFFSDIDYKDLPAYSIALFFSHYGGQHKGEGTKIFERVLEEILKEYLQGEAYILGFPSSKSLEEEVNEIVELINEPAGYRKPATSDKDRGVDVIAWKPFHDKRKSKIIVLLQAAAGWNWRRKKQIPVNAWRDFIHWHDNYVISAIGIAEAIQSRKWQNVIDEYPLVIDRIRIFRLNKQINGNFNVTLQKDINNWLKEQLSKE
jgi:hypothetical protein